MKYILTSCALLWAAAAPLSAQADCFVEYKAKRDNPLQLHYGIMQLAGDCGADTLQTTVATRLAAQNWILLKILSTSTDTPSEDQRDNAGEFYLRF